MQGIMIVDKPAGWTSFDVIAKLRGVLGTRKLGHSGTLDPMATGVLPVFFGGASKAVDLQLDHTKTYQAVLRLGSRTDTGDITGTVLESRPVTAGEQQLLEVLPRFIGPQMQVPPMYSALKVNGKKLYELAREGKTIERKSRKVEIKEIRILEMALPRVRMEVSCSKGTYIRTLCHDLGQALGCGGTMFSLRRTMAAGFSLEQALPLERVLSHSEPHSLLLPVDTYFQDRPPLTLPPALEKKVRNGMAFPLPGTAEGEYRVYGEDGGFLALSQVRQGVLTTVKSFYEVT